MATLKSLKTEVLSVSQSLLPPLFICQLRRIFFVFFSDRIQPFSFSAFLGWHSSYPAQSWKHIREIGRSKGNGEYWIDLERNGNPLKVYCDMTTDGGKCWDNISNIIKIFSPWNWRNKCSLCKWGTSDYDLFLCEKELVTSAMLNQTQIRG